MIETNFLTLVINNGARQSISAAGAVNDGAAIGASRVRAGVDFFGRLDSLRIWNVAKADFADYQDANRNLDYQVPRVATGMAAHYIFDDAGQTIQDFAMEVNNWNHGWLYAAVLQNGDANNLVIDVRMHR